MTGHNKTSSVNRKAMSLKFWVSTGHESEDVPFFLSFKVTLIYNVFDRGFLDVKKAKGGKNI